ncbi:MAG: hypothetical protein BRC58_02210 [Cyanobacteria bacterium QS_8_64_29]|nr:MAG: hypothetical protein BRC58_02210 [Cyanobacteria bacterium QS_8_64_29]
MPKIAPSFERLEAWVNRYTMLAVDHLMVAAKGLGVDSYSMEGFSSNPTAAASRSIASATASVTASPLPYSPSHAR